MAIVSVNEDVFAREAAVEVVSGRTYTRVFDVECDDPNDGPLTATNHPDIPTLRDFYLIPGVESDPNSYVRSIRARPKEWLGSGVVYAVTVSYQPLDPGESAEAVSRLARIQFSFNKFERVVWVDQDGNAIRNSAGDPFAEPVTIDDSRPVIVVTRNEDVNAFNVTLAGEYQDTVNQAVWNGFPSRTVKCTEIRTSEERKDPTTALWYYEVNYVFEVKWETWSRFILDQGFAYLDGSTREPFLDSDKQPVSDPKLLDGTGAELPDGDPPVTLEFRVYPDADFNTFNIDFSQAIGRT
jgi:hypothetical protein